MVGDLEYRKPDSWEWPWVVVHVSYRQELRAEKGVDAFSEEAPAGEVIGLFMAAEAAGPRASWSTDVMKPIGWTYEFGGYYRDNRGDLAWSQWRRESDGMRVLYLAVIDPRG